MITKIEGRANYLMGSYAFLPGKEQPPKGNPWKCSTLVIHDDKHECVFTEGEVTWRLPQCAVRWACVEGRIVASVCCTPPFHSLNR